MLIEVKEEASKYIEKLLESEQGKVKYYSLTETFFLKKLGLKIFLLESSFKVFNLIKNEIKEDNIKIDYELGIIKVSSNKIGKSKIEKSENIIFKEFILWKILNGLKKLTDIELTNKVKDLSSNKKTKNKK